METNPTDRRFYTFVREERQFSFLLAFFLMQKGGGLRQFIQLVAHNASGRLMRLPTNSELDDAEVYVEYAYLRDYWDSVLGRTADKLGGREAANNRKKEYLQSLFRRVLSLAPLASEVLPEPVHEFNAHFMDAAGSRIKRDVASPALWSVGSLAKRFGGQPKIFRDLCKLKWSFHIKPDVVIEIPGLPAICVEAKLESGEGSYPTGKEAVVFDDVVGRGNRVGQFELQRFMFRELLGRECLPVVVQKHYPAGVSDYPVVIWGEVFSAMIASGGLTTSIPFVTRLTGENTVLLQSYADHRINGRS